MLRLILTQLFGLPLEPTQNLRPILVGVLVGNTLTECLHIGDRRDPGLDQSVVRCFEALLGSEFIVIAAAVRGILHLYRPPPLKGEKDRTDDYVTVAASGHRVLEPLTKRVLTLLKLVDFLLQIVANALDARQRSFAGQRGLRPVVPVRI